MEGYTGYAIRFISGKYQGNEIPLKSNQEIIIGRGSDLDIVLIEDMMSRRHTKLITSESGIVLQDLGSTNGSFVNGERVRKTKLQEGDRILLGTSIMKLVVHHPDARSFSPEQQKPQLALGPAPGAASSQGIVGASTMQAPAFNPGAPGFAPTGGPGLQEPPSLDFIPSSGGAAASIASPSSASMPTYNSPAPAVAASSFDSTPSHTDLEAPSIDTSNEYIPPPEYNSPAIMSGALEETPLLDLLELFSSTRRNGVLVLRNQHGREGRVHLRDGRIVYCIQNNNITVPSHRAGYRILAWQQGQFELYPPHDEEIRNPINEDALQMLKAAQRQEQEIQRFRREVPESTNQLSLQRPLQAPLRDLRPEYLDTLQLVLNYGQLDHILNKSKASDPEIYQQLAYLLRHNYIKAHS